MKTSFGNIEKISLESILQREDFNGLCGINKDQFDICKDCEFRNICIFLILFSVGESNTI
jgi:MoaA/NifB/PqqE/SkfB family radical SAM enzyme